MVVNAEIHPGQLAELVEQIKASNEVLLTQDHKPVARLIPAAEPTSAPRAALQIRALKGHRVLTPIISQQDLADEMFSKPLQWFGVPDSADCGQRAPDDRMDAAIPTRPQTNS